MSVLVNSETRLLVQGLTGKEGTFHSRQAVEYGTQVVAGVTPGKGGADVDGIPVFDSVDRAIDEKQYMWGSLVFDPAFSNLHSDPRWEGIRARDGRSEEQLKKIDF